tara:strand:- start:83 stop:1147 length:1065 start_codon:yes stop_codon:yes gene_type:complete
MRSNKDNKFLLIWLLINLTLIIMMVAIGGITRLTDSGLSMTNWRLFMGIIPPLNESDWIDYFNQYKKTPEFMMKNFNMTLPEFKKIFFWEYLHRIWGRLIGLVFFLPLVYFWLTKKLTQNEKKNFFILSLIGFFQAFMGWFMVKSGLYEKPDVSHFRLSAHLLTAFIIYSILLYIFWNSYRSFYSSDNSYFGDEAKLEKYIVCSILILLSTIVTGAFVAGTNSGLSYNNFPLMDERIYPPILASEENKNFLILLNDSGFIQFLHRIFATLTLVTIFLTFFLNRKSNISSFLYRILAAIFLLIIFQYILGITILLLYVPISLGLFHQLSSMAILSILVIGYSEIQFIKKTNKLYS